jgi:hypothetical protein
MCNFIVNNVNNKLIYKIWMYTVLYISNFKWWQCVIIHGSVTFLYQQLYQACIVLRLLLWYNNFSTIANRQKWKVVTKIDLIEEYGLTKSVTAWALRLLLHEQSIERYLSLLLLTVQSILTANIYIYNLTK